MRKCSVRINTLARIYITMNKLDMETQLKCAPNDPLLKEITKIEQRLAELFDCKQRIYNKIYKIRF